MSKRYSAIAFLASLAGATAHAQLPPPRPQAQTMSIDWERSPEAAEQARQADEKQREKDEEQQKKMMEGLKGALGGLGKGGSGGGGGGKRKSARSSRASDDGGDGGESGGGESGGSSGGSFDATGGGMQSCGTLPASVAKNLKELKDFRKACAAASTGSDQKFAINDYSCKNGQPMMYLFDTDGTCAKKMPVTFGNGQGAAANSCPKACSVNKSHLTPPGFHLTAPHHGAKYGPNNSLLLVGLEGQNSASRQILIHGAANPGTATSWGCSGVGHANLMAVLNYLGNNALVYNAFDSSQLSCSSQAGMNHDGKSCRKDPGAPTVHPFSGGSGQTSQ